MNVPERSERNAIQIDGKANQIAYLRFKALNIVRHELTTK